MNRRGVADILLAIGILLLIIVVVASSQKVLSPLVKLAPSIQAEEVKLTLDATLAAPGDLEYTYSVPEIADQKAVRFITFGRGGQVCVSSMSICEMISNIGWDYAKTVFLVIVKGIVDFAGDIGSTGWNLLSAIGGSVGALVTGNLDEVLGNLASELGEAWECFKAIFGAGDCDSGTNDAEDQIDNMITDIQEHIAMTLSQLYCQQAILDPSRDIRVIDGTDWLAIDWETLELFCDPTAEKRDLRAMFKTAVSGPLMIIAATSTVAGELEQIELQSVFYNEPDKLIFRKTGNLIEIEEA